MRLVISVPGTDEELLAEAQRIWESFVDFVVLPITIDQVTYHPTPREPTAVACTRPMYGSGTGSYVSDRVHLILSRRFFDNCNDEEQYLTLLHESIHMAFALGEHRQRWQRIQQRVKAAEEELLKPTTLPPDLDLLTFRSHRNEVGFTLLTLPDEIVAEQRLKRDYPEWFDRRAVYYVRMRQDYEHQLNEGRPGDRFWPFCVFYELLRVEMFIPLVEDGTDHHAELNRLAGLARELIDSCASPELLGFLNTEKRMLLDITVSEPFIEAEAAYDRIVDQIMTVSPT